MSCLAETFLYIWMEDEWLGKDDTGKRIDYLNADVKLRTRVVNPNIVKKSAFKLAFIETFVFAPTLILFFTLLLA